MGMYDTLRVRRPLPDGWSPADDQLQTKDLDRSLAIYEITAEGRLVKIRHGMFDDGPAEGQPPVDEDHDGEVEFHGAERFHEGPTLIRGGREHDASGNPVRPSVRHGYLATFVAGDLASIVATGADGRGPIAFSAPGTEEEEGS